MRLTALTLALLSATTFSGLAVADNAPQRSPELQVLDRFVGTWDAKVTVKPMGGKEITSDVVSHRSWSLGGTFVRFEDANNLKRPEANEFQMLLTYDANKKNYPSVFMDGPDRSEITGTWDAKTTTMHWKGKLADGNTFESKHPFIGRDRAEPSAVIMDADGRTVAEMSWSQTRRKTDAKEEVVRPADLPKDDPLEPLNRRVGTRFNRIVHKKAEWTPEERTTTGDETIKWVTDGAFIQDDTTDSDGSKAHWLGNYDADANVYRYWYFGNRDEFPRGDTVGRWNATKERMDWALDFGNGVAGKMVFQFSGKDKMEWSLVAHDVNGKLMLDSGGTHTRKGTAGAASLGE